MKKLLFTNVVFGDVYSKIFLDYHLGSLLDETNIPAFKERIEYIIFTDADTKPILEEHPNYLRLKELIPVSFVDLNWLGNENRFAERYTQLILTFRKSVMLALERDAYLSAMVADLVVAKDFLKKCFSHLEKGHDAVFMLPLRSTMEPMSFELNKVKGALSAYELFELGFSNLHPLWTACHWDAPQFTKMPFSLLWNTGTGIVARSFSITPIMFQPQEIMKHATGVIDVEIPSRFKDPYWCNNWTDAPVIGVEPMQCYATCWANHRATAKWVRGWALKVLHPSQILFLQQSLYYPDKEIVDLREFERVHISRIANEIMGN